MTKTNELHWVTDWVSSGQDGFNHALEIHKPYGVLDTVLDWTKTNAQGRWGWQLIRASSNREDGRYVFFFDQETDYLAFILKWE